MSRIILLLSLIWCSNAIAFSIPPVSKPENTRFFPLKVDADSFKVIKVRQAGASGLVKLTLSFTINALTTCQEKYAGFFQTGIYSPNFTIVYARTSEQQCSHVTSNTVAAHELWVNLANSETPIRINSVDYVIQRDSQSNIEIIKVSK